MYATDLDRTLVFSSKFRGLCTENVVCVERKDGKDVSYMTKRALALLDECKALGVKVVPVTTRSYEQYKRIDITRDCEYAVTTNGGVILYNGFVLEEWKDVVGEEIVKCKGFDAIPETLSPLDDVFETELRLVDGLFYYAKLDSGIDVKERVARFLDSTLDSSLYSFTIQGRKLYVIPKGITKERALSFIMQRVKPKKLVTSGDGKLDKGFLEMGDVRIIPSGSELLRYLKPDEMKHVAVQGGLAGTGEMLEIVKRELID